MIKNILNIQGIKILDKQSKISVMGGFDWRDDVTCFHICPGACDGMGNCQETGLPPDWP